MNKKSLRTKLDPHQNLRQIIRIKPDPHQNLYKSMHKPKKILENRSKPKSEIASKLRATHAKFLRIKPNPYKSLLQNYPKPNKILDN